MGHLRLRIVKTHSRGYRKWVREPAFESRYSNSKPSDLSTFIELSIWGKRINLANAAWLGQGDALLASRCIVYWQSQPGGRNHQIRQNLGVHLLWSSRSNLLSPVSLLLVPAGPQNELSTLAASSFPLLFVLSSSEWSLTKKQLHCSPHFSVDG